MERGSIGRAPARASRVAVLGTLAAVLAAQAWWAATTTSGTVDEVTYLALARDVYEGVGFARFPSLGVAPLPILLGYTLPALTVPTQFVPAITLARLSSIVLFGVPLLLIVYLWLEREVGPAAAAAGTALVALSPNVVAHVAVATTDICFVVCVLVTLRALVTYVERPSRRALGVLAVALGVTLSAKYSALGLFAVVALAVLGAAMRRPASDGRRMLARAGAALLTLGVLCVAAFLVCWALHGFALTASGTARLPTRVPAPIAGVIFQLSHQLGGHEAFLLGRVEPAGWWYYMPVALALKSTPAELVVMVTTVLVMVGSWRPRTTSAAIWRLAVAVYVGVSLLSRIDIGVRYFLWVIPLAIFVSLEWAARVFAAHRGPWLAALLALIVLQASSAAPIAPHYLSYFNALAGGPAEGFRSLADSNVDWGQDLPALRAALERVGARQPLLAYFGSAPLDAYGVSARAWVSRGQRLEPADWIAISATYLDGLYVRGDPFAPFRRIPASARAGYSIFLWATDRPDVREAFATAAERLPR